MSDTYKEQSKRDGVNGRERLCAYTVAYMRDKARETVRKRGRRASVDGKLMLLST